MNKFNNKKGAKNYYVAGQKKGTLAKKDHQKKSVVNLAGESLGPALFSTPDIIRRVGSAGGCDKETPASPQHPTTATTTVTNTGLASQSSFVTALSSSNLLIDSLGSEEQQQQAAAAIIISEALAVGDAQGANLLGAAELRCPNLNLETPDEHHQPMDIDEAKIVVDIAAGHVKLTTAAAVDEQLTIGDAHQDATSIIDADNASESINIVEKLSDKALLGDDLHNALDPSECH